MTDFNHGPGNGGDGALPSGDLSAFSMLDLFRMEAQQQARVLTDGLLLLERGSVDGATLEALMRAAHSVKGAAAIVGLQPVVGLAHAMEDLFVAAQENRLVLASGDVDVLLSAIDLLLALAALPDDALHDANARFGTALAGAIAALNGLRSRGVRMPAAAALPARTEREAPTPMSIPMPPAPAPAMAPAQVATADATPAGGDELLALAGQSRLYAGQLQPWIGALQRYRRQQRGVAIALEALHDAVLASGQPELLEKLKLVQDRARPLEGSLHRLIQDAELYERRAVTVATRMVDQSRLLRMCAFREGTHGMPRVVRDLGRSLGKDVQLIVNGGGTLVDRAVLAGIEGPLNHLLRNAVDHGMEPPAERMAAGKAPVGTIRLEARHRGGMLHVEIDDDGRGVDPERIRSAAVARRLAPAAFAADLTGAELMEFLFLPGFSLKEDVSEISGRGVGLDIVRDAVLALNGSVRAETRPGLGFRTTITLPLTQSIVRALVVDVAGEAYALPIARIERVVKLPAAAVRTLAGRQYCVLDGEEEQTSLLPAAQVLDLGAASAQAELPVVVIGAGRERYGLVVDAICGEQSLAVQPLEPVFGKLRDIASGALRDDGAPVLVLDVPDLLRSIARLLDAGAPLAVPSGAAGPAPASRVRRVLVVDDSLTVREMQRKILTARGYRVDVALDGVDAWNQLRTQDYDLVVTDIDMPRLDGIGLLQRIRQDPRLARLPAMIVSYKERPEDRARGLEAGADYYLAKGAFHDASLLEAVEDLIGAPGAAA